MKFYIPNDRICQLNEDDCIWLNPADFSVRKKSLILDQWANGWIFESDDSFNSFFTLITGNQLPTVTDAEYAQFVADKVAFLGKDRCEQFRLAWAQFQPKINTR